VPPTFRLLPLSPDAVNAEFLDRSVIEDTPLPRGADARATGVASFNSLVNTPSTAHPPTHRLGAGAR
jgi:hypothetical protein